MTAGLETLIYAIPAGETERYTERLLSTQCRSQAEVDALIARATADGWHSFRVTDFDPDAAPDFGGSVK